MPFDCEIQSATISGDTTGSAIVDIWVDAYPAIPNIIDTVVASAKPTLSSQQLQRNTTLTGWTKKITAGSLVVFNLESVSGLKTVTVNLHSIKTSFYTNLPSFTVTAKNGAAKLIAPADTGTYTVLVADQPDGERWSLPGYENISSSTVYVAQGLDTIRYYSIESAIGESVVYKVDSSPALANIKNEDFTSASGTNYGAIPNWRDNYATTTPNSYRINSGRVEQQGTGGGGVKLTCLASEERTDGKIVARSGTQNGIILGLCWRVQSNGDCYLTNGINLYKRISGTVTAIGNNYSFTPTGQFETTVEFKGNLVRVQTRDIATGELAEHPSIAGQYADTGWIYDTSITSAGAWGLTDIPNGCTYFKFDGNTVAESLTLRATETDVAIEDGAAIPLEVGVDGWITPTFTATLSDGGAGGVFTPTTVVLGRHTKTASVTYQASTTGTINLSVTGGGLAAGTCKVTGVAAYPSVTNFSFTLPESKMTSAGVFALDGTKIRDLWGGRRLAAGVHNKTWDGLDDDGNKVQNRQYEIKVLHHNIQLGFTNLFNSSDRFIGRGTYAQLFKPPQIKARGNNIMVSAGYNEGGPWYYRSTTAVPGVFDIAFLHQGGYWVSTFGDQDETHIYSIVEKNGYWSAQPQDVILCKSDRATGEILTWSGLTPDAYNFETGPPSAPAGANYQAHAVNIGTNSAVEDKTYRAVRLAAQQTGTVMAVSQPNSDRVVFKHKTTGLEARTTLTVEEPTGLAWSNDEQSLWVVSGNTTIKRFSDNGTSFTEVASFSAPGYVVDITVHPSSGFVVAAIGGTVQQIRAYNNSGVQQFVMGDAGGYANTAIVSPIRFEFQSKPEGGSVSYDADGNLYIWEYALLRLQKWNPALDTLLYTFNLSESYHTARDVNDNSRLFASRYIGFVRDWGQENEPGFGGGGAWVMDRYWGYGRADDVGGIQRVCSVDGKLYAYFISNGNYIGELTDEGIRVIGTGSWTAVDEDFNLYSLPHITDTTRPRPEVRVQYFAGLDENDNPTWDDPVTFTTYSQTTDDPVPDGGVGKQNLQKLGNGAIVITRNKQDAANPGRFFIGAMKPESTTWLWRHGRGTSLSVPFRNDGLTTTYSNDNKAAGAYAANEFTVFSNNGEFYLGGQSASHPVYNKDGLYLRMIGQIRVEPAGTLGFPGLGQAGNALNCQFLYDGANYRYLMPSEAQSSGLWEFTFKNIETYGVATGTVSLGGSTTLSTIAASGNAPAAIDSVADSDDFNRADSGTIGNGWSSYGSEFMSIVSNTLRANVSQLNNTTNYIYRGSTMLDSLQRIYIPAGLWGTTQVRVNAGIGETRGMWAFCARLDTATGRRIQAVISYVRYNGSAAPGANGTFTLRISTVINGITYSLGMILVANLPDSPGHAYMGEFIVVGTQPTRLMLRLYDTTDNKVVGEYYTESYDTDIETAGYSGIICADENSTIDTYERRNFTWTLGTQPPIDTNYEQF